MISRVNASLRPVLPLCGLLLAAGTEAQQCLVTTDIAGGHDVGTAIARQVDGRYVLAGYGLVGSVDFAVVRYNADFTLDSSFGTGGRVTTDFAGGVDHAEAIAIQPDGKIVVAGYATLANRDFAVARYNLDGSLDTTFGTGGKVTTPIPGGTDDEIEGVVIDGSNRVVVAGSSQRATLDYVIARYTSTGVLDPAFDTDGIVIGSIPVNDAATDLVIQGDGDIVIGGWANVPGTNEDFALARHSGIDGSIDGTFGSGGTVTTDFGIGNTDMARVVVLEPDGDIVLAGQTWTAGNANDFGLARFTSAGALDGTFDGDGRLNTDFFGSQDLPFSLALQPADDKLVAVGYVTNAGNIDFGLSRYGSTGALDATFGTGGKVSTPVGPADDYIDSVLVQPDGRILVGGYRNIAGVGDFVIGRYNTDGSIDSTCVSVNLRSIGTNGGILHNTGTASIAKGSITVDFAGTSLPLPSAVPAIGPGDVLTLDPGGPNQEVFFIRSRDSATRVTVQTGALLNHESVPESYTIRRAYNTLQSWEDPCGATPCLPQSSGGRGGNLVGENRREMGIAYKDGPFLPPFATANSALAINGSTTDADRFLWLTVVPGQRHNGTAGTGVVVDGQGTTKFGIQDLDHFTRVEWLELARFFTSVPDSGFAGIVSVGTNALYQNLLIHDFLDPDAGDSGYGIRTSTTLGPWSFTVRNSIFYDGDAAAIRLDEASSSIVAENCTIFAMEQYGVSLGGSGGTATVTNTISMNNGTASFNAAAGILTQSNNISSDGTAAGTSPFTFRAATDVPTAVPGSVVFASLTPGSEDFHLQSSTVNDAVNNAADLSGSFCCDIDGGARVLPWDIGADDLAATTEVTLVSLNARPLDAAVEIQWTTSSELNNLGFHLYRSTGTVGSYERITARAIPGLGSSPVGATYRYRDSGLTNGVTYSYELEDIETTGRTKRHGPVSATPEPSDSSGVHSSESDDASFITYGDPAASSLRVLERNSRHLVLELVTEGFHAEPLEDGSVRLRVPGFETASGIPVRRTWVEAIAGRQVELLSVREERLEDFPGLRPSGAEAFDLVAARNGAVRALRRRGRGALAERGLVPTSAARIVSVGFQGETKKALLELTPLRWDGTTGQLVLARRLVVRVSFLRRETDEQSTNGVRGRRRHVERSHDERAVAARIRTTERGLHAVRYEDVLPTRRGVAVEELRLSRGGEPRAYHLEPDSGRFQPGSVLYFVSEGAPGNPYGNDAVYELEVGRSGDVMARLAAAPSGKVQRSYWHRAEWEENRYYQAALVDAPDLWLWDLLFAPVMKSYPVEVSGLAPAGAEPPKLSIWLQGASDFPANPDHHVRVYFNGSLVEELSWDGKQDERLEIELAPGLLRDGPNVLSLENVGDTEAAYSMVMLDRYALEYRREALPGDGRLEGRFDESGAAEIAGFPGGAHVLDTSETAPRWLVATEVGAYGALRFRAQAGHRYLAVSPDAVHRPSVTRPRPSGLRNARNRADYLVIAPEAFLPEAIPLLSLREREGLEVKAVAVEDVYSEFGFGERAPEAIRDFLSYAYHNWRRPSPRYVLLLGDATYDFKDYLGTGVRNRVPPLLVKTSYLWTASDPSYAAVNGDDFLPDVAIGRLPAATAEQARVMVEKIVKYETGAAGLGRAAVVLVADDPDRAGDFEADAASLAAGVLAPRRPQQILLRKLGAAATRSGIVDRFDEGASLVSYLGHGGIHLWADENVFDRSDVESLAPQTQQPLLLTMNCLNGYFHFPYFDSLAEALVKSTDRGAIAAFSPSGLSLNEPAHLYHQALLNELFSGRHRRLGDAVLAAQERYAEAGGFPELLTIYHLLGDPALMLK